MTAVHTKSSTTRLPQSLLDQVNDSQPASGQRHTVARGSQRKAARKRGRILKKENKAYYFSNEHKTSNPNLKRNTEGEHSESPNTKKPRVEHVPPQSVGNEEKHARNLKRTSKPLKLSLEDERFVSSPRKTLPRATSTLKENDEAYVAYLESKLGLTKAGKKRSYEEDGLDDLLNFADSIIQDIDTEGSEDSIEGSDTEQSTFHHSTEVWNGISQATTNDRHLGAGQTQQMLLSPTETITLGSTGRYVPPQLRNFDHDDSNTEAIQKLKRHLKGLLNRMSEQNITTIITSVEGLYRDYRRHDVTSTLTTLIINGISNHSSLLDSFVVVYAAFVSSLHKIIGIDFAAHFVQHTVASYEQYRAAMQVSSPAPSSTSSQDLDTQKDGKECSNLLVLVSELYNFQVISSVLVFDMIRALLDGDLTEFSVELLLKLLRNSGQQLRQDDPSALKDIISIVHGKVAIRNEAVSSRTTFMIETLTNLKNNKLKRNVTQNQGGAAVERMKKFLSNLNKIRQVVAHESLRISLEDLRSANSKGKWWLVGAGWGGDPLVDKNAELSKKAATSHESDRTQNESDELVKLARGQGMNTEIRRGIFIVLMSSDDYLDACERLSRLNLTEIQQREIVRVLLHCCGNERLYNPYYTLVCQQLCRVSHTYKITLQYCMWDFLRDLGETQVGGAAVIKSAQENNTGFELQSITHIRVHNVAKAYSWWMAKDSVGLLLLRPVDFTVLRPRTREFLKELMVQIFLNSQRSTPLVTSQNTTNDPFTRNRNAVEEIFIKASRIQSLAMGLVYFLSEAFENNSNADDGYSKFIQWAVGTAKATLQTGIDVVTAL